MGFPSYRKDMFPADAPCRENRKFISALTGIEEIDPAGKGGLSKEILLESIFAGSFSCGYTL